MIEVAAGDTTACSTPDGWRAEPVVNLAAIEEYFERGGAEANQSYADAIDPQFTVA
jgi:hypothetical protein